MKVYFSTDGTITGILHVRSDEDREIYAVINGVSPGKLLVEVVIDGVGYLLPLIAESSVVKIPIRLHSPPPGNHVLNVAAYNTPSGEKAFGSLVITSHEVYWLDRCEMICQGYKNMAEINKGFNDEKYRLYMSAYNECISKCRSSVAAGGSPTEGISAGHHVIVTGKPSEEGNKLYNQRQPGEAKAPPPKPSVDIPQLPDSKDLVSLVENPSQVKIRVCIAGAGCKIYEVKKEWVPDSLVKYAENAMRELEQYKERIKKATTASEKLYWAKRYEEKYNAYRDYILNQIKAYATAWLMKTQGTILQQSWKQTYDEWAKLMWPRGEPKYAGKIVPPGQAVIRGGVETKGKKEEATATITVKPTPPTGKSPKKEATAHYSIPLDTVWLPTSTVPDITSPVTKGYEVIIRGPNGEPIKVPMAVFGWAGAPAVPKEVYLGLGVAIALGLVGLLTFLRGRTS